MSVDRVPAIAKNRLVIHGESQLRLQTIVRLRWIAVLGQFLTVCVVRMVLDFPLPLAACLGLIALSAWINVFLRVRFPARHRLSAPFATALLAYDILQLAALLYLTGGIENPFTVLIVAPVTVSAATLPPRNTILLGAIAAAATCAIALRHEPLPWIPGSALDLPAAYEAGLLAAALSGMTFLGLYAWRVSKEGRLMSAALAATELVLAREQKLHALDDLAAAAAHELGTPLSTIVLITTELEREISEGDAAAEDLRLLRTQAQRCREILQRLTRRPGEADPLHARVKVGTLVEEAAAPYRTLSRPVEIDTSPDGDPRIGVEPVGRRQPGMIYGLGNLVENAVDFAARRVEIGMGWDLDTVSISIADDGPGFAPEIMDSLGEPYITTRGAGAARAATQASGLGLGFFIAKTLLERSGATVSLSNRAPPGRGAVVRIVWRRDNFEAQVTGAS